MKSPARETIVAFSLILGQVFGTPAFAEETLYQVALRDATKARQEKNYSKAIKLLEVAIEECQQPELRKEKVTVLNELAENYLDVGKISMAQSKLSEAMALCIGVIPETDSLFEKVKSNHDLALAKGKATLNVEISNEVESKNTCTQEILDGNFVQTISNKNLCVSALLFDTGRRYRIDVCVRNQGNKPIEVYPHNVALTLKGKKDLPMKYINSDKLASSIVRWAKFEAGMSDMANAMNEFNASQRRVYNTAYVNTSGTIWGWRNGFDTYSGTATVTMSSPDYGAIMRAQRKTEIDNIKNMNLVQAAQLGASQIRELALKANTVRPGNSISGTVFFARKSVARAADVHVSIGKEKLTFSFAMSPDSGAKKLAKFIWYGPECIRSVSAVDVLDGRSMPPLVAATSSDAEETFGTNSKLSVDSDGQGETVQ